jgi:hypothetical protein
VQGGHLWVLPVPVGKTMRVEVRAGRGLHIGGRGRIRMNVEGGTAGLIFDARGRPLPLAADVQARAAQLLLWASQATGDPIKEADEAWFAPLKEEAVEEAVPQRGRRRRGRKAEAVEELALPGEDEFEEFETLPEDRRRGGTGKLRDLSESGDDDDREIGLDDLRG